ncbi:zinc finger CCHC-type and RNA-binding motif-containing protein 1-like [Neltuma alba]|uniref:zinc finger CCHC-type and RNA-binding motif-containing protein 1-like n=1 Tax=Neltuma alba TaxID=207710 RepID=UPI0010A46567|nr:zinc finger CCHC-type and RNA-binding motif-containing protein 1-like [Prosopis alba]
MATVERGKFARVSVEIDLNRKLQSRFMLRKRMFTVEYKGLEEICFKCGRYGHKLEICPLNMERRTEPKEGKQNLPENKESMPELKEDGKQALFSMPGVTLEEEYGTWMKAKHTL